MSPHSVPNAEISGAASPAGLAPLRCLTAMLGFAAIALSVHSLWRLLR
jgi:hypothetical protein